MPLQPDIVSSTTVIEQASPATPGFGVPIIGLTLTAPQDALWGPNLIQQTTQSSWMADLTALGFVAGDPVWQELLIGFSQEVVPDLILLGKRVTPTVPQVTNFDLGAAGPAADGLVRITLNGVNFDHTAAAETKAVVVTALIALIGADPAYGAVNGADPEQIDVTAAVAGVSFSFAASAQAPDVWITGTTTPSVGLAQDLTAWNGERKDWYYVTELSRDLPTLVGTAPTVEAFPRDIVFQMQMDSAGDPDALDGASTTRAGALLAAGGYQRTGAVYVPTATDHDQAAHYFRLLPTTPGVYTWTNVELRAIDGETYTETQTLALRGRGTDPGQYTYYEEFSTRNAGVSRNARMGDGTRFEHVRDRDFINSQIVVNVSNTIIDAPKIDYTDPGAAIITGVIAGTLGGFVGPGGILVEGSVVVTTLPRSAQAPPDIAAGDWLGWEWSATLTGSIDGVTIAGTLFIV